MSVSRLSLKTVLVRSLGTIVLVIGCLLFMARAPFLQHQPVASEHTDKPPLTSPPPAQFLLQAGAMSQPVLPDSGMPGSDYMLQPSFGLFNASFAASDDQPGFRTSEHPVAGGCKDAGKRFLKASCPDCQLIGGESAGAADMLLWNQVIEGRTVLRAASRNCTGTSPAGLSIVGTLDFEDAPADLGSGAKPPDTGRVPLLAGGKRVASITLGEWSATYDQVPRPSSALSDMTSALKKRGWREVSDPELLRQEAFEGQRVFTNKTNWLCMISLTRQGDEYQLLTVINSRA